MIKRYELVLPKR